MASLPAAASSETAWWSCSEDEDSEPAELAQPVPDHAGSRAPDVFVAHGVQPFELVDHLRRSLEEAGCGLEVVAASCAVANAGALVAEDIFAQHSRASVGTLVITKDFVRTATCMAFLHRLLGRPLQASSGSTRTDQHQKDQLVRRLVVVLDGLAVKQLQAIMGWYRSERFWYPAARPDDVVLIEWAADLLALTELPSGNIIQRAEWQDPRQVADLAVQRVLHLLEAAGVTAWKKAYAAAQEAAKREWERQADELMPGAPPSDIATAIDKRSKPPDVFLSHPGELKLTVVDVIYEGFKTKQPRLVVFLDEQSVDPGMRALHAIGQACRTASVGVLMLSPEFVRKKYCMAELNIFLRRKGEVQLLPVLHGDLTVDDLSDMRRVYASQKWCVEAAMPEGRVLDAWAADLNALSEICLLRRDQWVRYGKLVELVVAGTTELLEAAGKLPEMLAGMELHSCVRSPSITELVGRQEQLQVALHSLAEWRYVEIRGGPGEGKSTLAQHAVKALCAQWQQLPRAEAAGKAAYALEVDLSGS